MLEGDHFGRGADAQRVALALFFRGSVAAPRKEQVSLYKRRPLGSGAISAAKVASVPHMQAASLRSKTRPERVGAAMPLAEAAAVHSFAMEHAAKIDLKLPTPAERVAEPLPQVAPQQDVRDVKRDTADPTRRKNTQSAAHARNVEASLDHLGEDAELVEIGRRAEEADFGAVVGVSVDHLAVDDCDAVDVTNRASMGPARKGVPATVDHLQEDAALLDIAERSNAIPVDYQARGATDHAAEEELPSAIPDELGRVPSMMARQVHSLSNRDGHDAAESDHRQGPHIESGTAVAPNVELGEADSAAVATSERPRSQT